MIDRESLNQLSEYKSLYTPRASLCAFALIIQNREVFNPINQHLKITQKKVIHSANEKIIDGIIGILADIGGVVEINTKVRSDRALQLCFGRNGCAEQSNIQKTLDACNSKNVAQMMKVVKEIFQTHCLFRNHNYQERLFLIDIDGTGLPSGKLSDGSLKGYQPRHGEQIIRYGRQMCRSQASLYGEIIVDRIYPGNIYMNHTAPWVLDETEDILRLTDYKRRRTILRTDSAATGHLNNFMQRGFHIHSKQHIPSRIKEFARNVKKWTPDPENDNRELGWFNDDFGEFIQPIKRIILRWLSQKTRKTKYGCIISSVSNEELLKLVSYPYNQPRNEDELVLSYSKLYDLRAGTIEVDFKQDKQGLGILKRSKKRFESQQMMMLMNQLAHNVIIWMRDILCETYPEFSLYGIERFRRDIFNISGKILIDKDNRIKSIILNENFPLALKISNALKNHLFPAKVSISTENF